MSLLNELIKDINAIDTILIATKKKKYSEPIDINIDNWMDVAKSQSISFQNEHIDKILSISTKLLDKFEILSKPERKILINSLERTQFLQDFLCLPTGKRNIKNSLLILLLKNLGSDTRDSLLELNEIIRKAESQKIDYKRIVEDLIPLADNTNKHGMGSMREILTKVLIKR